ncbi:ATP-binding cassette domain-containing protein [Chloroflexota bacterium]
MSKWKVGRGEAWALLGPSGCGKTTLLSLLAALRFPTSGNVFISERPLTRPRPHTGLILQDYGWIFRQPCVKKPDWVGKSVVFTVRMGNMHQIMCNWRRMLIRG